ncbi:MAG: T9SS type A sorting domain-containing protein [Saprospiraceae bacterium]|nr:T9SS type A sorting domain-containing protein [Saprospiraceae bacterium]
MKITGVLTPESGGLANGKITLGVNGGTPPFKYSWSNGSIVKSPNNLAAGTYTVTVNDANNCSKEASFEILLTSGTEDTQDCYPTSQQSGRELYLTTCFTDGALWLRDLNGKIILHQLFHNTNSRLDVSNLSKGIYILYFENKERNESQFLKIFIQ